MAPTCPCVMTTTWCHRSHDRYRCQFQCPHKYSISTGGQDPHCWRCWYSWRCWHAACRGVGIAGGLHSIAWLLGHPAQFRFNSVNSEQYDSMTVPEKHRARGGMQAATPLVGCLPTSWQMLPVCVPGTVAQLASVMCVTSTGTLGLSNVHTVLTMCTY